jgi:hypothetical protein
MNHLENYVAILRWLEEIDETCKKAKTTQMKLLITRDALLNIKAKLRYFIVTTKLED